MGNYPQKQWMGMPKVLKNVWISMHHKCEVCIVASGRNLEHLLWHMYILLFYMPPIRTKVIHDLTIATINKCLEFQNDWLKIIPIMYNCTQFRPIPLC